MSKQELDNLVGTKQLKAEPPALAEYTAMVESAGKKLADAESEDIETDSQFDLAYGAAHRLALAALRREGYRSENRITVFQTLVHTVDIDRADLQVFLKAHTERNFAEYQGRVDIDAGLLAKLIASTKRLEVLVKALKPPSA